MKIQVLKSSQDQAVAKSADLDPDTREEVDIPDDVHIAIVRDATFIYKGKKPWTAPEDTYRLPDDLVCISYAFTVERSTINTRYGTGELVVAGYLVISAAPFSVKTCFALQDKKLGSLHPTYIEEAMTSQPLSEITWMLKSLGI